MKKPLILLSAILFGSAANAASVSFGPASAGGTGPTVNFSDLAVPTSIIDDATLTFTVRGDFGAYFEYIDVSFDGFSLGRVFNNNSADDAFDFASDQGDECQNNVTGSATISAATFNSVAADGLITLSFDTNSDVNYCGSITALSGTLSYDAGTPSAVPLPASALFLLGGFAAFGAMRARKKS